MILASRLARSRGSKSQLVRIMRTIEGVSAKGNSPGFESPKQCLCTRLKVRCNGGTKERDGSTMVWNGREELLPLVVGSIGLSAQGSSSRVNPIQGYILVQLTPKQQSIRLTKPQLSAKQHSELMAAVFLRDHINSTVLDLQTSMLLTYKGSESIL